MNNKTEQISAVQADFSADSDKLFIAFGSLRLDRELPPFEYGRTFQDLPVKKILLRDLRKMFYLRGLPDISTDVEGTRDYLQGIIQRESISKITVFGGSGGGYAALLMGWLLAADEVYAFAPMTFLPTRRGWRWFELVRNRQFPLLFKQMQLVVDPRLNRRFYDLKRLLSEDNGKTKFNIYFPNGRRQDLIHCQRMEGLPGVRLLAYDYDNHHIDRHLKDRGDWLRIFEEAV